MTRSSIRRSVVAVAAVVALSASCSDGRSVEAFCDQVEATVDAGPLFPDRTDGEPVPDPDALAAIEELADVAPDEIRASVEVLVAEANALVADAAARDATTTTGDGADEARTDSPHPPRADVEAAQSAVSTYSVDQCEVSLEG